MAHNKGVWFGKCRKGQCDFWEWADGGKPFGEEAVARFAQQWDLDDYEEEYNVFIYESEAYASSAAEDYDSEDASSSDAESERSDGEAHHDELSDDKDENSYDQEEEGN